MNKPLFLAVLGMASWCSAQLPLSVIASSYSITCDHPAVTLTGTVMSSTQATFTWICPGNIVQPQQSVSINSPGTYTVVALENNLVDTMSVVIGSNTMQPVTTASSTFAVLTPTTAPVFTFTALSPTLNITHVVYSPLGGSHTSPGPVALYIAGAAGTYTQCFYDNVNGCSSCGTFVVAPPGGPGTPGTSWLGEPDPLGELGALATHHGIRIWCGKPCEVFIYGIHGQELRRISLDGHSVIEIPLSPGIYFVGSRQSRTRARKVVVL